MVSSRRKKSSRMHERNIKQTPASKLFCFRDLIIFNVALFRLGSETHSHFKQISHSLPLHASSAQSRPACSSPPDDQVSNYAPALQAITHHVDGRPLSSPRCELSITNGNKSLCATVMTVGFERANHQVVLNGVMTGPRCHNTNTTPLFVGGSKLSHLYMQLSSSGAHNGNNGTCGKARSGHWMMGLQAERGTASRVGHVPSWRGLGNVAGCGLLSLENEGT
ncbi:uncharacterized protein B0H64DRAFT_396018 [Chaetomium fimeti]|uniref:Uncharacterized protein n=1 Tax=Chaetomium fimeti TaxID=1854472 RepID=A0AAE0HFN7_9PEZI|nr:hypothetical protein B0H64DRAFT_396018 [Chaetomium fimeti]